MGVRFSRLPAAQVLPSDATAHVPLGANLVPKAWEVPVLVSGRSIRSSTAGDVHPTRMVSSADPLEEEI